MDDLAVGSKVALHYMSGRLEEASIASETPKFLVLSNGYRVRKGTSRPWGKAPFYRIEKLRDEHQPIIDRFRLEDEQKRRLDKAKLRLRTHIDSMLVGHFSRCSPEQIYAALEALDKIFERKD